MTTDFSQVEKIAQSTRNDFERGLITDREVIDAAIAIDSLVYNAVSRIGGKVHFGDESDAETVAAELKSGIRVRVGLRTTIKLPILGVHRFPENHCDIASTVLYQRLKDSNALSIDSLELIDGGLGEDEFHSVQAIESFDNIHTFLGIGATALGGDTIVDITADQFSSYGLPPVYIGPLKYPWTRTPKVYTL